MKKYKSHFCLVSDQPIPNITPVLDHRFKPQKVVMLVSEKMQENASNLAIVYRNNQIESELIYINNPYDLSEIMQTINQYLEQNFDELIALNITGGTKPMAIASQEIFSLYKKDIFYINVFTDELMFILRGSNTKVESYQIEDQIDIKNYLQAFGILTINSIAKHRQIPVTTQKLMQDLVINIETDQYIKFITKLNGYAYNAVSSLQAELDYNDTTNSTFINFLNKFNQSRLLNIKKNTIIFLSEQNRFFCNGGWLEDFVFVILRSLKKELKIQDITSGLEIQLSHGSRNELDVVFIANNRFFIVECKTKKYKSKKDVDNTLYKLDSIRDYGGLRTKAILISYHKIKTVYKNRAKDYGIKVIDGKQLHKMKEIISDWVTH